MTICYAYETLSFTRIRYIQSSSSKTILILRILSEAAGVFLGPTMRSTLKVIQWIKISRPDGLIFPECLALRASTDQLWLLVLALGRGLLLIE